jgi:hypothetical protein
MNRQGLAKRVMAGSGTHTGDSSPARCNLARLIASGRSVLTRSLGLRGINDGATRRIRARLRSAGAECRNRKGRPHSKIEGASHDSPASPSESSTPPACCHARAAPPACRLGKRHRDCVFVHIQADVNHTLLMTSLLCMRLGAGPSSATLVNLHCETGRPISGEHLV